MDTMNTANNKKNKEKTGAGSAEEMPQIDLHSPKLYNPIAPDQKPDIWDRLVRLRIFRWFEPFYRKYKEVLMYLFFGGLAFFLNLFLYWLFVVVLNINALIGNIFCWILCVAFQYYTNKTWVFDGRTSGKGDFVRQFISFWGGRLFTLAVEELMIFVFITSLHYNEMLIKLIAQVVVIVLNYIISKLVVFRRKAE